jgi:hypothetical protein
MSHIRFYETGQNHVANSRPELSLQINFAFSSVNALLCCKLNIPWQSVPSIESCDDTPFETR